MTDIDLNLLPALDALLRTRSVTAAAHLRGLSVSAMSRTLARLRAALGDPLLVPAGRAMVLTPRAEAIAGQVHALAAAAQTVLRPEPPIDVAALRREFVLRANESFIQLSAARLCAAAAAEAPGVHLRFVPKPDKEIAPLREGRVDLDIGVIAGDGGELHAQLLFHDRFVGIARSGHPLLGAPVTPAAYCAWGHVAVARRRDVASPVAAALAALGLSRHIGVTVPSFPAALAIVAASDLIGLVPRSACAGAMASGITAFALPVETPGIAISQIWHPRLDADAGHRWLRRLVFSQCRADA